MTSRRQNWRPRCSSTTAFVNPLDIVFIPQAFVVRQRNTGTSGQCGLRKPLLYAGEAAQPYSDLAEIVDSPKMNEIAGELLKMSDISGEGGSGTSGE